MPQRADSNVHHSWPRILLLAIAYLGFVSLGLPDTVAGVAWPSVRQHFSLHQSGFGLVFIALGCGYCASGFFGGKLTQFLGLGNLLWISSGLVSLAMFGSSLAPVWPVFVTCAAIWGVGSGGIDAGLNSYVSSHFSARHVNWLHACYSLGATVGPLLMTDILLRTESWRLGYVAVGGVLFAMALQFFLTRRRWDDSLPSAHSSSPTESARQPPVGLRVVLRDQRVLLQIVLFFLYVGLEFTVGQWSYTVLKESRGFSTNIAGMLTSAYYGAIGVGRVLAGAVAHRVGLDQYVRGAMGVALAGATLFAVPTAGEISSAGLVLIGLGLAPVFPCLMARTPARLGTEYAMHAVGFQVSAGMLGAALVPSLAGLLIERLGLELISQLAAMLSLLLLITHELLLRLTRKK